MTELVLDHLNNDSLRQLRFSLNIINITKNYEIYIIL